MWDKRYGGTFQDVLHSFKQTTDGGFILGGRSDSEIGCDKSEQPWGNKFWNGSDSVYLNDYWVVKIDSFGNKQWDKRYGGTEEDELYCLNQSIDGGFILGGRSFSGVSGDKTQPNFDTINTITSDMWIVKIDSLGNKQWDKTFGGTDTDESYCIQQTSDGGYIVGGFTASGISGNKMTDNFGSVDYWVIKIDSLGNKQWENDYGGTGGDIIQSIIQSADGGYVLGGTSTSGINGNKTTPSWGYSDYWILKIDSVGNILWDRTIGGDSIEFLNSVSQTSDGGFILGGNSSSGISGNKTQDIVGRSDFWIVKTDVFGNIEWDKTFGGLADDYDRGNVSQTSDHGYLISGPSYSHIGGNKTEDNLGPCQTWVVKTDSIGNFLWDKTILTTGQDYSCGLSIQSRDGCYLIANATNSGIGGYKSEPNWDSFDNSYDFWIIKFSDSLHTDLNPLSNFESSFRIYPNPSSKILILESAFNGNFDVKIFNLYGQPVFIAHNEGRIDIQALSSGIYTVVISQEGKVFKNKFVKN